ncbi:MAG TPA: hypothetical protein VK754_11630, partial [Propionibacteriaceae bacterium]|nr:hypothetical protein [Propionibacteriaceae bacterium]
ANGECASSRLDLIFPAVQALHGHVSDVSGPSTPAALESASSRCLVSQRCVIVPGLSIVAMGMSCRTRQSPTGTLSSQV